MRPSVLLSSAHAPEPPEPHREVSQGALFLWGDRGACVSGLPRSRADGTRVCLCLVCVQLTASLLARELRMILDTRFSGYCGLSQSRRLLSDAREWREEFRRKWRREQKRQYIKVQRQRAAQQEALPACGEGFPHPPAPDFERLAEEALPSMPLLKVQQQLRLELWLELQTALQIHKRCVQDVRPALHSVRTFDIVVLVWTGGALPMCVLSTDAFRPCRDAGRRQPSRCGVHA